MAYKKIGNATAEWEDAEPFVFTMTEATGPASDKRSKTITINLTYLRQGFEDEFLLNFKDSLIERRNKIKIESIKKEAVCLQRLFRKVMELRLLDSKIKKSVVDEELLLCLRAIQEKLADSDLVNLLRYFSFNPYSPLFAKGLQRSDFPLPEDKKGRLGNQIDRIVAKALSQAAVAYIIDRCDTAFDAHRMGIHHYSFAHLAIAVFCRPASYRQIQLKDLCFDTVSKKYFIFMMPVKTRGHHPAKIAYQINEPLGILLTKQRQNVVETYGHLVASEDIEKLALFPALRLRQDGSRWTSDYANKNFGMLITCSFITTYPEAIKKSFKDENFTLGANRLRHTVGTLLAQTGVSAQTIQAVLKHSTDTVCRAYVDIAFHGLIKVLSDAMRPAFVAHIPAFERFRSKNDPISIEKSIRSEDLETGQIEQTGECGKSIACSFAPITCYGCFRFIPCWDADHSINFNIAQREIDRFSQMGKPFEHMVEKARTSKSQITLVMNAADRYQDAMRQGRGHE